VILSRATQVSWHLERAAELANRLQDSTRRLVFSFCDFYGKGEGRLHGALQRTGTRPEDITAPEHRIELERIARSFGEIANSYGLEIFTCCEEADLTPFGIEYGACIDGELIRKLFGGNPSLRKDKSQRKACRCVESVDMGSYNSCTFGCAYCYANFNEGAIDKNRLSHDPDSPVLLGRYEGEVEIRRTLKGKTRHRTQ
jgi:hypothetical protein